ncbi:MAG TPA: tetratricopeptide repeat protein, partial [Vicinamibacteria bacterium]|nr:tetratricopeptide repeat protein [Vicinamibacteria bacterium]
IQALDVRPYEVKIPENGYLQAAVQQQGVDLELELVDPAGRVVGRRDVHAHRLRAERLSHVSATGGTHLLRVRAHADEPAGRFMVRVEKLQPATAHDRLQAAADLANEGGRAAPAEERRAAEQAARTALSALVAEFRSLDPPRLGVVAVGLYHLGLLEVKTGDAAGEGRLREALALAVEDGNEYTQMLALTALADAQVSAGALEDALAGYSRALQLAEAVDDAVARPFYVAKSALVLSGLGRFEAAGAAFARARDLYRAMGNRAEEVRTVNNAASALRMLGDYPRALEAAQEALALARAAGLRELEAALLVNVARLHGLLGAPAPARARYQEALAIAQALGAAEDTAASANGLATLSLAEHDFARALRLALAGFTAWKSIGNVLGAAHSSDLAGQALHGQAGGDARVLQEAHDRLQWALDARGRFRHRSGQAETLVHLARLERDRGRLEQALAHARTAVELADGLRGDIDHPDFRAAFAASHQETYDLYVEL